MGDLVNQLSEQRRKVDFDTYDITVQQLISMIESAAINIAPVYQRQYRWDHKRQCQFIESIFLGIPIPSLFMAADKDGTWELVDGVQRLSTIVHFAGGPEARKRIGLKTQLALADLEKLSEFTGYFADLPQSVQLHFKLRPIKVTTLSDKSDPIVRFDLFERLNTGGIALTDQEIRGCIFRGQFSDFLERLAADDDFRTVVKLPSVSEADGTREEYVLRFFAYLERYKQFGHSVVSFLNDFMRSATTRFDYAAGDRIFKDTFRRLADLFPDGLYRRQRVTPVNLYEAVAVGAALVLKQKKRLKTSAVSTWVHSEELKELTTVGTNDKRRVIGRIEFCAMKFGW